MKIQLLATVLLLSITVSAYSRPKRQKVVFETDSGRIVIALYNGTPQHRDNMIKLVKAGFYDSLLWHRVIPGFMIQGGDPESKLAKPGAALGEGDIGYRIPAEINDKYYHARGALGAARDGNPEKKSSGCQFYIVVGKKYTDAELDAVEKRTNRKNSAAQRETYKKLGGTPFLDGNYTVFGEVVEGQDVADKIASAVRDQIDRPIRDIRMKRVYLTKKKRFFFF